MYIPPLRGDNDPLYRGAYQQTKDTKTGIKGWVQSPYPHNHDKLFRLLKTQITKLGDSFVKSNQKYIS